MKSLVIEGWRFLPHSYAMVAQHFCLELQRRRGLRLYFREMPPPLKLPSMPALWSPEQERALRDIPPPPDDLTPDAVLRLDFPHRLDPDPRAGPERTFIWGTTEFKLVEPPAIASGRPPGEALAAITTTIIACSGWAREGFVNAGAPPQRCVVVPCGVDTGIFHPLPPDQRTALRRELGWEGKFILLNVSAMTPNKGIDLLLKAAAQLTPRFPKLCVALKGSDALYSSRFGIDRMTATLSPAERTRLATRTWYAGEAITTQRIAQLMQAADAYISPYRAEGFNLPALEAVASGLPLLCTRGGSTEDFLPPDDSAAMRINSTEHRAANGYAELVPSPAHLGELMARVMADPSVRARAAGPAWAAANFTWRHAADQLLKVLSLT